MSEEVGFSFKKRNVKNKFARKRKQSSDESASDEETGPAVVKNEKKNKRLNPNVQSTSNIRKQRKKLADGGASTSSEEEEDLTTVSYRSKKEAESALPKDQGATAELQFETEKDKDAQTIFERSQQINKELEGKEDDKVYRGLNNYTQYIKKRDTAQGNASSGMVRKGPIRAPANLRATVRWDYQPDICKDYKETGFCGFGDSCKFLHDRSDYKHGWQMEYDESNKYTKKYDDESDGEDETKYEIHSDEEELPFKCFICRKSFKDPIVTKCKHYFCEKCALERYKKSARCVVCGVNTNGVFNPAKNLIERLKACRGSSDEERDEDEDDKKYEIKSDDESDDDDDE
ncbi:E3 ubiquitin-protein ligase RNF113A [Culicoides brevitarsis]|uniref:E3 ubiquitin-protein ligase RNF113A n=1 Tax=Culicoides brevitarsis TaxID=469753 RepID=UPI00307CC6B8